MVKVKTISLADLLSVKLYAIRMTSCETINWVITIRPVASSWLLYDLILLALNPQSTPQSLWCSSPVLWDKLSCCIKSLLMKCSHMRDGRNMEEINVWQALISKALPRLLELLMYVCCVHRQRLALRWTQIFKILSSVLQLGSYFAVLAFIPISNNSTTSFSPS